MGYVWVLDIIRFAAATLVALFHFTWRNDNGVHAFASGWVGVEIFFVISGFVITGSAHDVTAIEFLRKRFARLYPTAICCALLSYAVILFFADEAHYAGLPVLNSFAAFVRSIALLHGPFLTSALWTLPIELMFYLLVTGIIISGGIRRIEIFAILLTFWSAPYLILFFLHSYALTEIPVTSLGYGAYNLTLWRHGCFFGLGILLWFAAREPRNPFRILMMGIAILLCCIEIAARSQELSDSFAFPVAPSKLAISALVEFFFCVFLILLSGIFNSRIKLDHTKQKIIRTIGLMTYPVYLTHEATGGAVLGMMLVGDIPFPAAIVAAMLASLAAGFFVVAYAEPPLRACVLGIIDPFLASVTKYRNVRYWLGQF